jgi:hypothetical protein
MECLAAKVSRFEGNVGPGGGFMAAAPRNGPHFAATFLCHPKKKETVVQLMALSRDAQIAD